LQNNFPQQAQPIRVTMDFSLSKITQDTEYLKNLMQHIQVYLQQLLKVIPAQGPNKFHSQKCDDIVVPIKYRTDGERNSDVHIWVVESHDTKNFLASAVYCQLDNTLKRVNYGIIKVNMNRADQNQHNSGFKKDLNNLLHECFHILGFSSGLYEYWVNPLTGDYYGEDIKKYLKTVTIREKEIQALSTPNVLATAQKYYSCPTLEGMLLENIGPNYYIGSHWKKTIMLNELMSSGQSQLDSQVSVFTIALLRDSGFYAEVNESMAEDIQWGRNRGCEFVLQFCYSETQYPEYQYKQYQVQQCSFKNNGYGLTTSSAYVDKCKYIKNQIYCEDQDYAGPLNKLTFQYFGVQSKCLQSTANDGNYFNIKSDSRRCHYVQCSPDSTQILIIITQLNYKRLFCNKQDEGKEIEIVQGEPQFGHISCPDNYREFCGYTPECPKYCSRKGICISGQCKCQSGWTGFDCNVEQKICPYFILGYNPSQCVKTCPTGFFANPDRVCRDDCPKGFYKNNENQACANCDISCIRCTGPTMNDCIECGFLAFLEEGNCVQQCRNDEFQLVDQRTCIKSVNQGCDQFCERCNFTTHSQCTLCQEQYFLNLITRKCVPAYDCPKGTFANDTTNTCEICELTGCDQCAKCPKGCLKCSRQCVSFCPENQFADIEQRKCVSIITCEQGSYYWQNKCYDKCPRGTLTENNQCLLCPQGCLECPSQQICSQCDNKNGWILQNNESCTINN
ncbi:leishmanolysin family protein, putative, partial [Ichthyophthirius multifiliis]